METSYKYTGAANTMYLTIFEAKFIYCSIQYGNTKTIFSLDLFDFASSLQSFCVCKLPALWKPQFEREKCAEKKNDAKLIVFSSESFVHAAKDETITIGWLMKFEEEIIDLLFASKTERKIVLFALTRYRNVE